MQQAATGLLMRGLACNIMQLPLGPMVEQQHQDDPRCNRYQQVIPGDMKCTQTESMDPKYSVMIQTESEHIRTFQNKMEQTLMMIDECGSMWFP